MAFVVNSIFSFRNFLVPRRHQLYRMASVASSTAVSTVQDQAPPIREFYGRCEQVKTSPQKLNLVAKLIRRMKVVDALVQLEYCDKKVATFIKDTLKETQKRAIKIHKANPNHLYVSASYVGKGTYLKRIRYHGKGRSGNMYKYYSHYFLKLQEGPPPVKRKKSKEETSGKYATRRLIQRGPITIPNCL